MMLSYGGVTALLAVFVAATVEMNLVESFSVIRHDYSKETTNNRMSRPQHPDSQQRLLSSVVYRSSSSVVLSSSLLQESEFEKKSVPGATSTTTTASSSTTGTSRSSSRVQLESPIILFDGVCNFCNTWVDILLRIDTKGVYKLTPLQSSLGQSLLVQIGKQATDISSIVLIETNGQTYYTKSDCVVQVVSQLGLPFQIVMNGLKYTIPQSIRDTIYDTIAENRYNLLGKRDICRSGDPIYFDRFLS